MEVEKENRVIETAIDIETKSDEFGRTTQPHNEKEIIVTKNDRPTQPHNGKKIDRIIVSEYDDSYAVTYSKEDNSIQGWSVNIEEDGQQQPGVYLRFDQQNDYFLRLYNKTLIRNYRDDDGKRRKYLTLTQNTLQKFFSN
jgi:hypothetical protein